MSLPLPATLFFVMGRNERKPRFLRQLYPTLIFYFPGYGNRRLLSVVLVMAVFVVATILVIANICSPVKEIWKLCPVLLK